MRRSVLATTLVLLGSTALGACSNDATGPGDPLTPAERVLLAQSLFAFGFEATAIDPSESAGSAAGVYPTSEPRPPDVAVGVEVAVPCPVAGEVLIVGTLQGWVFDSGETALSVTVDQAHQGCVVSADDGGVELRIDGEPGTTLSYDTYASGGSYDAQGTLGGAVRYTAGDRSGVCATDLTWAGSGSMEGRGSFTISGTICGTEVSTTVIRT